MLMLYDLWFCNIFKYQLYLLSLHHCFKIVFYLVLIGLVLRLDAFLVYLGHWKFFYPFHCLTYVCHHMSNVLFTKVRCIWVLQKKEWYVYANKRNLSLSSINVILWNTNFSFSDYMCILWCCRIVNLWL